MKKIISVLIASVLLLASCDTVGKGNRAEAVNLVENRISYRGVIKQQTEKSLGEILEEEKIIHEHFLTTTITSVTTETTTTTTTIPTEIVYTAYKPSTNYVHLNTCRWFDNTCVEVTTSTLENVKRCTECNPAVEIVYTYSCPLSEYEQELLRQLIANEYGGKKSVIERAKIVAAVMNGCKRNNQTVTQFIYSACVPWGFNPGYSYYNGVATSDMNDAIEQYFTYGEQDFYTIGYWESGADSWYGDGYWNHFYRA